jgi:hypothetical protein
MHTQLDVSNKRSARPIAPPSTDRRREFAKKIISALPMETQRQVQETSCRWDEACDDWLLTKAQALVMQEGFADYKSFARKYRAIAQQIAIRPSLCPEDLDFSMNQPVDEPAPVRPEPSVQQRTRPAANWREMDDEEVLAKAQAVVDKEGFTDEDSFRAKYKGISYEFEDRGLSMSDIEFAPAKAEQKQVELQSSTFDWDTLSDDDVLARAQRAIERNRFPDLGSFADRYRGISYQIIKRGLPPENLEFRGESA